MQDHENADSTKLKRAPWNKGKLDRREAAAPAKARLVDPDQAAGRGTTRDLAMFNLAIDSKLRGCDLVALKVEDVAPSGYAIDRATIRQKKTGQPVELLPNLGDVRDQAAAV